MEVTEFKVRITFTEEVLGTEPSDKEVYTTFVGAKAPDAATMEEEIAALGTDAVIDKQRTVFSRDENGKPHLWDYQIKGFLKGACGFLRKVPDTRSSKVTAYKKKIDGNIFVKERRIPFIFPAGTVINDCQRPLRAETAQGARTALAISDAVPAGVQIVFTIQCFDERDIPLVKEWLDYGKYSGIGQWRNSGKGRFVWEEIPTE